MNDAAGRGQFIAYLNSLTPAQAAAMRRAAFAIMEANGGALPAGGSRNPNAGWLQPYVDLRTERRPPSPGLADPLALKLADYRVEEDGTIYRIGPDGLRTRADTATDPYARLLADRLPGENRLPEGGRRLMLYPRIDAFPRSQEELFAWYRASGLPLPQTGGSPPVPPQLFTVRPSVLAVLPGPGEASPNYPLIPRGRTVLVTGPRVTGPGGRVYVPVTARTTKGIFATGYAEADSLAPLDLTVPER
jgi:hypothetical protein